MRWRSTWRRSRRPIPLIYGRQATAYPLGIGSLPEGPTLEPLVATAYWAYDVTLMQQMAHALGKTEEEAKYADLFSKIRTAFANEFIHSRRIYRGGRQWSFALRTDQQSRSQSQGWRYPNRVCAGAEYEAGARLAARRGGRQTRRQNSKPTMGAWQPDFWVHLICWRCWSIPGTAMLPTACCSIRNIPHGDTWWSMAPPPCGSVGTATRCAATPA